MSIDRMDDPGLPLMDGVSVSAGRQRYWKQIDMAPVGASVRLIVADRAGHLRALPYPCRLTAAGWVNAATGAALAVRPTHWQLYVETLPSERAWARRAKVGKS